MSMYLRHGIPYGIMMCEEKCPIVYFKPWASYFLYWQKALAEVGRNLKLITEKNSIRSYIFYICLPVCFYHVYIAYRTYIIVVPNKQ